MIIATLCTTSGAEPWGANVPFEVDGACWTTTLKTKYSHFQNLKSNPRAIIVYSRADLEMIIKAKAKLEVVGNQDEAKVVFVAEWLRLASDNNVTDIEDKKSIAEQINQRL